VAAEAPLLIPSTPTAQRTVIKKACMVLIPVSAEMKPEPQPCPPQRTPWYVGKR
jgi:hypothetical protein